MLALAKIKKFPQKTIYYGKDYLQKKSYTPVLNFYDHQTKLTKKPS